MAYFRSYFLVYAEYRLDTTIIYYYRGYALLCIY
nr:MAG TPA: hypothetical protein [Caudoviricetes sp.]